MTGATGCLAYHRGPLPGEPADAAFLEAEGARVRYLDVGPDAPSAATPSRTLLLLHGFSASLNTWDPVVPALRKQHRVIALDLKGFGWTDRPEGDYSPQAQARLALAVLDARGAKGRVAVVGHSWGASVAMNMALLAPERVERLALYDAYCYEEQVPSFFAWARARGVGETMFRLWYRERVDERVALAFHDKRLVTEALVEDVEAALDRPGAVAAALAAARGQRYREIELRWREIKQPVLLLWGKNDAVTRPRYGERLARELPRAKLIVYPKCGHFPMLEALEPSTRDLVRFLEEREDLTLERRDARAGSGNAPRRRRQDAAADTKDAAR